MEEKQMDKENPALYPNGQSCDFPTLTLVSEQAVSQRHTHFLLRLLILRYSHDNKLDFLNC